MAEVILLRQVYATFQREFSLQNSVIQGCVCSSFQGSRGKGMIGGIDAEFNGTPGIKIILKIFFQIKILDSGGYIDFMTDLIERYDVIVFAENE